MQAAKPEVKKGRRFNAIWIIPLVTVVLGVWMVVHAYLTQGPEIRVTFDTASGIEAGKTKVKFRDVEMGMVQEVNLSPDMQAVTAVIKMQREALPLLREDTLFWIVTARIGSGTISGLGTLLSGAYIQLSPGTSDDSALEFTALEEPPLTPAHAPGIRLKLFSESASATIGDPVLYHGIKVGRVESQDFDPQTGKIQHSIFIDAPYHVLVTSNTRFWDISGISVSAGAEGFKVTTGSLESILLGGVTFADPPDLGPGQPVDDNTEFRLFPDLESILDSPHEYREYYVVKFEQSVKGLLPGAPVSYRGIEIGKVERIMLQEQAELSVSRGKLLDRGSPVPVLFYIEPARVDLPDTQHSLDLIEQALFSNIGNGLRGSLETASLITGSKMIAFEYHDNEGPAEIGEFQGYKTLPTTVTGLSGLESQISKLLETVNQMPLEQTVAGVNQAVSELNYSLAALRKILENRATQDLPVELKETVEALHALLAEKEMQEIPQEVDAILESLRNLVDSKEMRAIPGDIQDTLAAARYQLNGESGETYQLRNTLKELELTARALREFVDALDREPESLIRGKSANQQ